MNNTPIQNRYEIMLLLEAKDCNPNGDPDMGNLPRQDPDTEQGIITDVAVKRRIRDYVASAFDNQNILMQSGSSLNMEIAEAVFQVNEIDNTDKLPTSGKKKTNPKVAEAGATLANKYWDVRTFGAVLSTGLNAGQINGPVQIAMSRSVDPITIQDLTITRCCYAIEGGTDSLKTMDDYAKEAESRPDDEKRTMGTKKITPYGLYVVKVAISANLAEKVGFTEDDLNILEEALLQGYNNSISASKMGMSVVSPLIIFKHVGTQNVANAEQNAREAKLGCASAGRLYELLSVKKKEDVEYPRSIDDYEIAFDISQLTRRYKGVLVGAKENPFDQVLWGEDARPVFLDNHIQLI